MSDVSMRILLSAVGGGAVTSIIGDIAKSLSSGGLSGALLGVTAVAAGTAVAIGVTAVKAAGDFESGLSRLVTTAGESKDALKMVGDGILQISVDTATSTDQLLTAMLKIDSSNYHGADSLKVLTAASQGAKTENADLATVTQALLGIMTNYHLKAGDATSAMNGLMAVVKNGNTTLQDLSGSMSQVLPTAASLGISFAQVGGAIDTMTSKTMPAQQAAQNLGHVLLALSAPSGVAVKSMKEVGLSAQQVKDALAHQGLPEALQLIEDHVGKKFPAGSVENVTALKNIMGGMVGYKLAAQLTGASLKDTKTNIDAITDGMKNGKGAVDGFTQVQGNFNFKMDQAHQALSVLGITIGTALLPVIGNLVTWTTNIITAFTDWIVKNNVIQNTINAIGTALSATGTFIQNTITTVQNITGAIGDWWNKADLIHKALDALHDATQRVKDIINGTIDVVKNIVNWFVQWHEPILAVSGAITLFFLPALIKAGVEAAIAGTKIAVNFVQTMINTGTQAVINGAKTTASFVASMIKSGVEAVVNGAKVTASFVASMAKAGVEAVVNGAKVTASFVASLIKTGIEGWAAAGKLGMVIAQFIATGVQAVIAGAKITAQFIASVVKAGISAVVTAAQFVGSLIPAIISFAATAITAAATAIPGLIAGLVGATGAAWAFTAALLANPITWIVLAIVAVIGLVVLAVTHWGQIVAWLKNAWGTVVQFFQNLWQNIVQIFGGIGQWFRDRWQDVANIFGKIGGWFHDRFSDAWNGIVSIFGNIGKWFEDRWTDVVNKFKTIFGGLKDFASGVWSGITSGVKGAFNFVIDFINSAIDKINTVTGIVHVPAIPHIPRLASGGYLAPGQLGLTGEEGPELLVGGRNGTSVISNAQSRAMMQSGAGGHTNNFYISISTMARSQAEVSRLVDMVEQEIGRRFRGQTPGYASGNIW